MYKGQTEQFEFLKNEMLEYDDMELFLPEKDRCHFYSGLNRELNVIFSHLTLQRGQAQDKHLSNSHEII